MLPQEKELQRFAKKKHHSYKKQAFFEGALATIPGIIGVVAFFAVKQQGISEEFFSPNRIGIVDILLPILVVSYIVFLLYVLYDIRERVTRK